MQALVLNITPAAWLRTKLLARLAGKRVHWGRWGCLRLRDVPPPELPGEGWVLCRTKLGGLCGTDLAAVLLQQPPDSLLQAFSSTPMILGHENVAVVESVHPSVDSAWAGQRVCAEPTLGCTARGIEPQCPRCAAGEFGACENFGAAGQGRCKLPAGTSIGYNSRTGGSWGEYFVAHVSQLVPVPEGLSDEQAVLTDPLACSLHAVLRTDLASAQSACVWGGGILGLGTVAALRAVGFPGRIDLFARYGFQRELGRELRATAAMPAVLGQAMEHAAKNLDGQVIGIRFGRKVLAGGYDVVYDCAGSRGSLEAALGLARARGQVVLIGTTGRQVFDLTPIWFRELHVIGAYGRQTEYWQGRRVGTYPLVYEMLLGRGRRVDKLLTHTFPLIDYRRAFAAVADRGRSGCVRAAFRLS